MILTRTSPAARGGLMARKRGRLLHAFSTRRGARGRGYRRVDRRLSVHRSGHRDAGDPLLSHEQRRLRLEHADTKDPDGMEPRSSQCAFSDARCARPTASITSTSDSSSIAIPRSIRWPLHGRRARRTRLAAHARYSGGSRRLGAIFAALRPDGRRLARRHADFLDRHPEIAALNSEVVARVV